MESDQEQLKLGAQAFWPKRKCLCQDQELTKNHFMEKTKFQLRRFSVLKLFQFLLAAAGEKQSSSIPSPTSAQTDGATPLLNNTPGEKSLGEEMEEVTPNEEFVTRSYK